VAPVCQYIITVGNYYANPWCTLLRIDKKNRENLRKFLNFEKKMGEKIVKELRIR